MSLTKSYLSNRFMAAFLFFIIWILHCGLILTTSPLTCGQRVQRAVFLEPKRHVIMSCFSLALFAQHVACTSNSWNLWAINVIVIIDSWEAYIAGDASEDQYSSSD